ncbi:MAG: right-handed parallel beta-helix repeat-containing protein, partial [Candidatus Rifleibacteriota bacterium]
KADANTNPELSIALKHIEATLPAQVAIPDMSLVKIIGLVRKMLDKLPDARPDIEQIIIALEEYIDEHLPEEPEARNSGRRSSRRSASSISGLVQSASTGNETRKKTTLIIILIAILLGTGTAAWKFELFKGKTRIDFQKEINFSINSADFNRARQLLMEYEATEEGKSQASYLKVELSKAMILKAEESAIALDYQKAINLYAQAIVLDPANPKAALNLSKLQQNFQRAEELKQRVEELKSRATTLLAGIEPASGTTELYECIKELSENGLATQAADISARWQTKFIAAASPLINGQPEKALQYLDELQKFFPEFKEVDELAAQARKKSDSLKDELANADRLNSLKTALNAAIDDYTLAQNRELIIKQIEKVAELGEQKEAAALKQKLAGKIAMEAEKLIVNDPRQALRLLENASQIFPDLEGLATKIQLASESLATIQSSEEMKIARENLIKEIENQIETITPPADITTILTKLEELSVHGRSARRVNSLKDKLFEKYFSAVALEIDRSPETAKQILAYCEKLRPDAPGLKELGANIDEKIQVESARKKAAEDKARMARLETAKNAIYTGIKKDPIPQDLEKLHAEVSALSRDYPESDAGEKLMVHLKNRCRDEISSMLNSGSDKAQETLDKSRTLFADDSQMIAFIEQSSQKLIERAQVEEKKKLVEKPLKEIEAFIKNPQLEKTESVKENLKQIETAVSENESRKLGAKIMASLQKKFDASETPEKAKANFNLIAAIDASFKDKTEEELEKLAKKKAAQTAKQIGELKSVEDLNKLDEKLKVFDTWNRQLEKTQALEKLKSVFLELASAQIDQEPEQAFEVLVALQKIKGLENDQQIKTQIDSIKKAIDSGKASNELQSKLATAESIFNSGEISDKTDELFKIIDYLKKNSPADAEKVKNRAAEKLLTLVENSINNQQFSEAEKLIILVKQFSPENEKAQKFQVAITEARKASEKPKEFIVGPTGTHRTINEAISAAPEGMKILIQPGTYNEKVVLNKNISLVGESASRCSITFANQPTIIIDGNAVISNLTLTNTSSSPQPTIHILKGNPEVSGCIISNSSPAKPPDYLGSILISGGNPKISKNQLISSKAMGMTISGGNPVVSANSITGCSLYGIWINGSGNAKISGNTINNNGKSGVGIKNSANPDFTGNTIEGNGENGLLIYGDAKGRYESNQLNGNTLSGIEIWDAQPQSIKNNNFSGNRRDGIFIRGDKAVARIGPNQMAQGQAVNNSGGKIIDL